MGLRCWKAKMLFDCLPAQPGLAIWAISCPLHVTVVISTPFLVSAFIPTIVNLPTQTAGSLKCSTSSIEQPAWRKRGTSGYPEVVSPISPPLDGAILPPSTNPVRPSARSIHATIPLGCRRANFQHLCATDLSLNPIIAYQSGPCNLLIIQRSI
jgi:hypothetical protein